MAEEILTTEELPGVKDIGVIAQKLIELGRVKELSFDEASGKFLREYPETFAINTTTAERSIVSLEIPETFGVRYLIIGDYADNPGIEVILDKEIGIVGGHNCIRTHRKGTNRSGLIYFSSQMYFQPPYELHINTSECGWDFGLRKATKRLYRAVRERWGYDKV